MNASILYFLSALPLLPVTLLSADTLTLVDGESKNGRLLGIEQEAFVLSAQPIPGLPAVDVRIPKNRVAAVTFGTDEQRDTFLQHATPRHLPEVAALWNRFAPLLSIHGSPAAWIGLRYGLLLLEADGEPDRIDPLSLFEKIAGEAPTRLEQESAKQGILRVLLRNRQWARAESEATFLIHTACGTALLAEARLTAGLVHQNRLRTFTEENPRWNLDAFARPQRNRLYESTLDQLLGAALLPGAPSELAVRARFCALKVCEAAGELHRAALLAEDILVFHSATAEANTAREWLREKQMQAEIKSK